MRPAKSTVAPEPVTVPAIRYVYSLDKQSWVEVQTTVRVPNPVRGFEAGGMRICFEIQEVDDHGQRTDMVAKFFRKNIERVVEIDYFNEGAAQCMSEEFAQNFNRRLASIPEERLRSAGGACRISFLMCQVVKIKHVDLPKALQANPALYGPNSFFTFLTTDTKEVTFVMEYKLKGTFTKYNNNFGETYESSDNKKPLTAEEEQRRARVFEYSEAFSHFSLVESGGSMLVCDLQGVNDFFTDPQIHTEDGKGLGMGNMGQEGIDKWTSKHKCNCICRAIGLLDLWGGPEAVRNAPIVAAAAGVGTGSTERRSHYDAFRHNPGLFQARPTADAPAAAPPAPSAAQSHDLLVHLQQQQQRPQPSPPSAPSSEAVSSPASPPKPFNQMTEEEQMEYAIQRSMIDTGRY